MLVVLIASTTGCASTGAEREGPADESEDAAADEFKRSDEPGVVDLEITGVDGPMLAAVRAALDIARYTTRRTIGSARLERLIAEAPIEARDALEPFGYYRPTVSIATSELDERRRRVSIAIELGEPTRVSALDLRITGEAADDPAVAEARAAFRPAVDEVFDHRVYSQSKAALERALLRLGYFDREFGQREVRVERAAGTAAIAIELESGARYRFGTTTISGAQFDDDLIRRYIAWQDGEPFDQALIEKTQNRLAATGYFGSLAIEPDLEGRIELALPIAVTLEPAKRSAWTFGAFAENTYGFGVTVGLDRRWVNRLGHRAHFELEYSQALTSLTGEYRIPHPSAQEAEWIAGVQFRDESTTAVDSLSGELKAGLATTWRGWNGIASVNALRSRFRIGDRRFDAQPASATFIFPEFNASRVFAASRLRPERGTSVALRLRLAEPAIGSDVRLSQIRVEARHLMPAGTGARLLSRLELGYTATDRFAEVPPELRFFAGGQGSIRGYPWQGVGPLDASGRPFGGRNVATFTLEYERLFRDSFSWAAFVDGGNVFFGRDLDPVYGVGAGIRWVSPVGPIRIDLARGLDSELGGWRLHFSAGPDL